MNENLLKRVLQSKSKFVPLIFTEKQFSVMQKYFDGKKLSNSEKKALYTSINKKLHALDIFSREQDNKNYFMNNPDKIINSRIEEAKKILDEYSNKHKKVFISGSFLFSKDFNDIDIFIICERGYKEKFEDNQHFIFLTEKKLADPIFQSASMISVSNFIIPRKINKKKPKLSELMSLYHEAVIENMKNQKKPEATRNIVFTNCLFCRNELLDGKKLNELSREISIEELNMIMRELSNKLFSKTYLYVQIHEYIKTLAESIKNIKPNDHLIIFKKNYEELIYGT